MYVSNFGSTRDPDFIFLGTELWPGAHFKLLNMNNALVEVAAAPSEPS